MQIFLMIEGQEGVDWAQWLRLGQMCEQFGFDGLYGSDHSLSLFKPTANGSLDAWTTLAALAASTDRIRLGTLVSPIAFRHPAQLARIVTSADAISGGRIDLGIGAGWYEREHAAFGHAFPDTMERFTKFEEYVEVVHRLLAKHEEVTFRGTYFTLDQATLLTPRMQQPHAPIVLGGQAGRRASALAAAWADEYNLYDTAPDEVSPKRNRLVTACESIGRNPNTLTLSVNANVLIARDRSELLERAARHAGYQGVTTPPEEYVAGLDNRRLIGTPDDVLQQLEAYARTGVTKVLLQVYPHDDYDAISLIASDVLEGARSLSHAGRTTG